MASQPTKLTQPSTPTPQPSSSSSSTTSSSLKLDASRSISPKPLPAPMSLSEWQLLAVLNRANLLQYYETFISKGGDDINQIMQCDEQEFLEIMSLVGMLSKPLHVRRLQKALSEYSQDQANFHLLAIQQIGPPPPATYTLNNGPDSMAALLLSSFSSSVAAGVATTSDAVDSQSSASPMTSSNSMAADFTLDTIPETSGSRYSSASSATANIVVSAHNIGLNFGATSGVGRSRGVGCEKEGPPVAFLVPPAPPTPSTQQYPNDFVALGDFDPNNPSLENPVLSSAQINRIAECALVASKNLPNLPPRLVQNKKRVSKEVLDLMQSSPSVPNRIAMFRKYSAIYGRFDTKRKPHKVLTLHETSVNEAAAQVCLLVPALLTRRDELFPLARQIVKDAGYHYSKSRKRPCDLTDMHSPVSSPSTSPPPGLAEQGFEMEHKGEHTDDVSSSGDMRERSTDPATDNTVSILEHLASGIFGQR